MPGTFTRLIYHVLFATKFRRACITPEIETRLHAYIGGIVRAEGGDLLVAGGMPDHIHLMIHCKADNNLSAIMKQVKSRSSAWVKENFPEQRNFGWQIGYAASTVSRTVEPVIENYIKNQKEHHRVKTFKDEMLEFLERHGLTPLEERFAVEEEEKPT